MATTTPVLASTSSDGAASARVLIWRFEASGWTAPEAGNLVALAHGLRPVAAGWTVREIEHLRFLRSLVRAGRIDA